MVKYMQETGNKKAGLTLKQVRFCQEYVKDLNATQAATRAGYSAKSARKGSADLMAKQDILAYIDHLQANVARELGISHRYVLEKIKLGIEQCKNNPSALFKGLELLGKHLGTFDKDIAKEDQRPAFVGISINMGEGTVKMISGTASGNVKNELEVGPRKNVKA